MQNVNHQHPQQLVSHLQPAIWAKVNRLLLRKAIAEFSHELLLTPELQQQEDGWGEYRLPIPDGSGAYTFRARVLALEHWLIDPASIQRIVRGAAAELDALAFIIEFKAVLGIGDDMMPVYLEEISSTLYGSAYKHARGGLSAEELTRADFQSVETSMMEGHPGFVANNGRIGFDAVDYLRHAPEAAAPQRLIWLAVHKARATFSCAADLDYQRLLQEELGSEVLAGFARQLAAQQLDMDDYLLMPAHPWQWFNKLAISFAPEVAQRHIVCLGYGEDAYLAQQSIRTFYNISQPQRRYVKTALSILNMGFMRGLSPYYMLATPAINDWIRQLVDSDAYLRQQGFAILREVASIGFRNPYFDNGISKDSPYKKMLSALWRESPAALLGPGKRLMTMAALLHIDAAGESLLAALIRSSGLDARNWVARYLQAYLAPLLHCFYAHELVFMPHGENLILQLENNIPQRAIMKDIAEEAAILNPDAALPPAVARLAVKVPEHMKLLALFTDVFDGFFRYLSAILDEHCGLPEQAFWQEVAQCVRTYQAQFPQLAERFARYDLFMPEFDRSCLNRLQLGNNQQMLDLANPAGNLKFAGTLRNPLADHVAD